MPDGRGATIARVALVSQLPPPVHGSTVMTLHLRDSLIASGLTVDVIDRRFSTSVDDIGAVRIGKLLAVPALWRRLIRAVRGSRPDVTIYFLTSRPGSFLVDVLLLATLRALRMPVVLYLHTVGYSALAERGMLWRGAVRRVMRQAQRVVTLGPRLVADIAPFADAARISTIANIAADVPASQTLDRPRIPARRTSPSRTFRLLFLSNLLPEKGVDAFVRIAARLVDDHPDVDWQFDIAGAGSADRLEQTRESLRARGIDGRCTVHGAVDSERKWSLLSAADLLVFPSTYAYEAQPLTIVEALGVGTPVVAYDIGGIGDLVIDGTTGVLVAPNDEARLTSAIVALESNRKRLAGLSAGAQARHRSHHSVDAYSAAWQQVLSPAGGAAAGRTAPTTAAPTTAAPTTAAPTTAAPNDAAPLNFAGDLASFRTLVRADWRANPRDAKSRAVLLAFRAAQLAMGDRDRLRLRAVVPVSLYRAWTESMIGLELRPKTRLGGGATIYHGYALVVNDHTIIGERVILRNGVTIGNRSDAGPTPIIGADVHIGAGAIILGGINIGDGAQIGAGAVVLHDVPAGRVAVGNPARLLPERTAAEPAELDASE